MTGNLKVTPSEILVKFNLKINLQIYVILLNCIFKITLKTKKKRRHRQILLITYFLAKRRSHEDGSGKKEGKDTGFNSTYFILSQLQLCYRYMM